MRDLAFDAAIGFARDLIRIPGLPGQEGEVAARVTAELESLRFDDVWTDQVGNVIGRIRGTGDGPAVMLSCHLDSVDVGEHDSWQHPPFSGDIADGFLHGRGAMDIKGPLALQTYAAAHFIDDRLPGDIIVAHTICEERGGWGMQHLLEQGELKPAALIIGEATAGDICIGHRGRAEIIIELTGVAGHASAPSRARNPIALLPIVLPRLEAFAHSLPSSDVLGPSTIAATSIETLPRSRNVIPDLVRIVLDWRVLPSVEPASAVTSIREALGDITPPEGCGIEVRLGREQQKAYTGVERERPLFTPGFLISERHPIVLAAREAIVSGGGREPRLRPWTFATDGGHACGVHGIPTIGYAPGEERYAHTNVERLELAGARDSYGRYPGLIRAVQVASG